VSEDVEQIQGVFLAESQEGVAAMESGLMALEVRPDDEAALFEVFRAAHTLKGNAGIFGLRAIGSFAHAMEDVLDRLRSGRLTLTREGTTLLLRGVDVLRELLAEAFAGDDSLRGGHAATLLQIGALAAGAAPSAAPGAVDPGAAADPQSAVRTAAGVSGPARPSIRVDVARLDALLALVGEIAVARDQVSQLLVDPAVSREAILDRQHEAERLQLSLHELTLSLRMVSVGPTLRQLSRLVRDLALSLGKEADLEIEGADAEVDNSVLQLLKDPLTHMVRNAVDHGIESPDRRLERGKPRRGRIRLRASTERGALVVELSDDGEGLDRRRVLEKARERGLVSRDEVPGDARLHELVFEPGFSTAGHVTDLSGRGVGLDVVRRNVEALRGTVHLSSVPGSGSTVTLRLPLTLAIIEGLVVAVGSDVFVLPMDDVIESSALPRAEAERRLSHGVLSLRGGVHPYLRLRDLLQTDAPRTTREICVVVKAESGPAGLVVDAVLGQRQVVIRPLPKLLDRVQCASAAAVLGDGRLALILEPARCLAREASLLRSQVGSARGGERCD
jgi:two-component system, chemotaxis family, sensor kinase CheA